MSHVTRILSAIEHGDPRASEQLLPLVYEELRRLAAQKMAQEAPGHTLQATALVHEAYLRLVDSDQAEHWNSRRHFFAAAAEAMRRILVDQARHRNADKRGGAKGRVELHESQIAAPVSSDQVLAVNEALDLLSRRPGGRVACQAPVLCRVEHERDGRRSRNLSSQSARDLDVRPLVAPQTNA